MPQSNCKICKHVQFYKCSNSTLSSESESLSQPIVIKSVKSQEEVTTNEPRSRDYLSRLFEKKKLKEKSLSQKLHTPFDRKLTRSCWPVDIGKVSKIKKKPKEKDRKKPSYRCFRKRKKIGLVSSPQNLNGNLSFSESDSDLDIILEEEMKTLDRIQVIDAKITPQMLVEVLQDSDSLK